MYNNGVKNQNLLTITCKQATFCTSHIPCEFNIVIATYLSLGKTEKILNRSYVFMITTRWTA